MDPFIGSLENIFRDAEIAARSLEPVLILGETGVGKEVLARYIHQHSRRKTGPFLPINCAAIPSNLLESELFGCEKGAFTGAVSRKGLLEQATGGTVLLDEVADIPLEAQAKLLRAIETGELLPLGASRYKKLDVRFIAATNRDIKQCVENGSFRQDLYYRLSIFVYFIPPLRQRLKDIPLILNHLKNQLDPSVSLSAAALELMLCYSWPGNVREMKNVLSYAHARAQGQEIQIEDLPENIVARCSHREILNGGSLEEKTSCFEAALLAAALKTHPKPKEAAEYLGVGLRTFYRKIKKYGLEGKKRRNPHHD